jgi:hypothetical protein
MSREPLSQRLHQYHASSIKPAPERNKPENLGKVFHRFIIILLELEQSLGQIGQGQSFQGLMSCVVRYIKGNAMKVQSAMKAYLECCKVPPLYKALFSPAALIFSSLLDKDLIDETF